MSEFKRLDKLERDIKSGKSAAQAAVIWALLVITIIIIVGIVWTFLFYSHIWGSI